MEFAEDLKKYQWPIIIGGGLLVGAYLFYYHSSSSSVPSTSSASGSAELAAQTATQESGNALAATQASADAQSSAYQAHAAAQVAGYQAQAQSSVAADVLGAYTSVQNQALKTQAENNQTTAELASNLYANTVGAQVANNAINAQLAAYTTNQVASTLQNQNVTQAYTAMAQGQSLAQQNISGNNALAGANEAGTVASENSGIGGIVKSVGFSGDGMNIHG